MAHTKLFAAVAAAALTLTAGASSATAYNPGNQYTPRVAIENCEANVLKQFELGLSGGRGPKSGHHPVAPTNCNKYFGAPGQL